MKHTEIIGWDSKVGATGEVFQPNFQTWWKQRVLL